MDISQMTLDELHAEWEKIKPTIAITLVPHADKSDFKCHRAADSMAFAPCDDESDFQIHLAPDGKTYIRMRYFTEPVTFSNWQLVEE